MEILKAIEIIFSDIFNLNGKVAVIIGGAGILCSAIASGLGAAGAKIAICDISDTDDVVSKLKNKKIEAKGYYIKLMYWIKLKLLNAKIV